MQACIQVEHDIVDLRSTIINNVKHYKYFYSGRMIL